MNTPTSPRTIARTLAVCVLWAVGVAAAGAVALGLFGSACGGLYGAAHGDLWRAVTWGVGCASAGAVAGLVMGVLLGLTEADAWPRARPKATVWKTIMRFPSVLPAGTRFPRGGRQGTASGVKHGWPGDPGLN